MLVFGSVVSAYSPPFVSHKQAIWKGNNPTWLLNVVNHLLNGMILQVSSLKLTTVTVPS